MILSDVIKKKRYIIKNEMKREIKNKVNAKNIIIAFITVLFNF